MRRLDAIRDRLFTVGVRWPWPWAFGIELAYATDGDDLVEYWPWEVAREGEGHEAVLYGQTPNDPTDVVLLLAHAPDDLAVLLTVAGLAMRAYADSQCEDPDEQLSTLGDDPETVMVEYSDCGECMSCQFRAALEPLTMDQQ